MKKSKLLRKAAKVIEKEKEFYVCYALRIAANTVGTEKANANANELSRWILHHIAGYASVILWVRFEKGFALPVNPLVCSKLTKAYRMAWCEDMARYWESKGE